MINEDGSVIPTLDEIENEPCEDCKGKGSHVVGIYFVDCTTCKGTGSKS